jgi:hypothetical protein
MRRTVILFLVVSAIAVALVAATRTQTDPPAPELPRARTSTAAEVAALRWDVERMRAKVDRPQVMAVPDTEEPKAEAAAEPPPDPEAAAAQMQERVREVVEELERRYASEPIDSSWSGQQSAAIRAAVGAGISGTTLSSASCASSLCKVVLQHDSAEAQMVAAREVARLPEMHPGVFYDYHPDAVPPQTVLYVLRAGTDIREMGTGSL